MSRRRAEIVAIISLILALVGVGVAVAAKPHDTTDRPPGHSYQLHTQSGRYVTQYENLIFVGSNTDDALAYSGTEHTTDVTWRSPGAVRVQYDINVRYCAIEATPYWNGSGDPVYATARGFNGRFVTINEWTLVNGSEQPVDDGFVYVTVTC